MSDPDPIYEVKLRGWPVLIFICIPWWVGLYTILHWVFS